MIADDLTGFTRFPKVPEVPYNQGVKRRPEKGENADAEDFARAMADVVRLKPDPRGRVRTAPRIDPPRAATTSNSSSARQDADDESEAAFVARGVDRRELRKLKRGDDAPGNRLDLHRKTAAEAVASVKRFIDASRRLHRSVCIVHGRGLHSEGNVAILKSRVRECLRSHPAVLAYADAPPNDGGPGAVYVLLRN
jgi:DNA-nicking Smr family endonuclease